MNNQVRIKAEQIARMIVAGKKATQIALSMNMSYGGLQRILACPAYKLIEDEVRRGNLKNMDDSLAERAKLTPLQEELSDAVPEAMKTIIDAVKQKRDLRMALSAARDVIALDPRRTFTRNSKKEDEDHAQRPALPDAMLESVVNDADATTGILMRNAHTQQPAEA